MDSEGEDSRRLLVISNRLPITISKQENDYSLNMSSGGLVSAMQALKGIEMVWIGWPGREIPSSDQDTISRRLWNEYKVVPVFLDNETIELYYNGFSNEILWPLFHYIPPTIENTNVDKLERQWEAYKYANKRFADTVAALAKDDDLIWVNDYHLMLAPKMIREMLGKTHACIGWFLHTPFPSYEVYRMLNYREEVLEGVLSADLCGFHIADYMRHFLNACTRILGLPCTEKGVENIGEHTVYCRTEAFPIGIDVEGFSSMVNDQQVQEKLQNFDETWAGKKIILGVDRLDYIKGIPLKLLAFEHLLNTYEEWIGNVVLVQIAVPSRENVPEYQALKSMAHEIVGRINSTYGRLGYMPVHYLDQSVQKSQLIALYRRAEVMFISSIRDGMNLVSYEYVACQEGNYGIEVLSEFAGSSKVLGAGAVLVNPWNIEETAEALNEALNMEIEERQSRHEYCYNYICKADVHHWAQDFMKQLVKASRESSEEYRQVPAILSYKNTSEYDENVQRLINTVSLSRKVLILVDEEGPFTSKNRWDKKIDREMAETLYALADIENVVLMMVSSKKFEESYGAELDLSRVGVAVENGYKYKLPNQDWEYLVPDMENTWFEPVMEVIKYFEERTPGSFHSDTSVSIDWSYSKAHYEIGTVQSRDLFVHLRAGPLVNVPAEMVITGPSSVQVRDTRVNKGKFVDHFIRTHWEEATAVICIGNFNWKDEEDIYEVFRNFENEDPEELRKHKVFHIRLGALPSYADYAFKEKGSLLNFLQGLPECSGALRRISI